MHRPEAQGLEPALARLVREALERMESMQTLGLGNKCPMSASLIPPLPKPAVPSQHGVEWQNPGSHQVRFMPMATGMFGFTERTQSREEGLELSQKDQELNSIQRTQAQPTASPGPI